MLLALPYKKKKERKKKRQHKQHANYERAIIIGEKKKKREAKKAILAFNVCKGHRKNMTNDEKYSLTSKTATAPRR